MKRIATVITLVAAGALLVAPASNAQAQGRGFDLSPAQVKGQAQAFAAKQCAAERKASSRAFKARYGKVRSRAMAACVRIGTADLRDEVVAAVTTCANELVADPVAFGTTYGDGQDGGILGALRAFPRCVKSKLSAEIVQRIEQFKAAVRTCVDEFEADRSAFKQAYGQGDGPLQAMRRCVESKLPA